MIGLDAASDDEVKILIVDDQPRNLDALEIMLSPLGCTLAEVDGAAKAAVSHRGAAFRKFRDYLAGIV